MSSLANTVILYNNDGEFSLDKQRKKEMHHGLELKRAFESLKKDASVKDILNTVSCELYKKDGQAYGHFKNFYNSIIPECVFIDQNIWELANWQR